VLRLVADRVKLIAGLQLAAGIADRRSTMAILANVLLRAEKSGSVLIAATDLNVTMTTEVQADIQTQGGITIGARHLLEAVKAMPGERVQIAVDTGNYAEITSGKAKVRLVGCRIATSRSCRRRRARSSTSTSSG
jgi:DNA polymerase-3 subunit beta